MGDIQGAFDKIGLTLERAIARGVEAGALQVMADAKLLVPKVTGTLQRSITYTPPEEVNGVVESTVGTNVVYGPMVEFGSGKRQPKPYLSRSLEQNINTIRALIAESIRTEFPDD